MATDLNLLNAFAVAYRYPGIDAMKLDAKDALQRCKRVRRTIRLAFGLSV